MKLFPVALMHEGEHAAFQLGKGRHRVGKCGHGATMVPDQRHAIFTITKKMVLGTPAAICSVRIAFTAMTAHTHLLRRSGACFQQVQQRCAAMRPVVISVWNKKTDAGNQN